MTQKLLLDLNLLIALLDPIHTHSRQAQNWFRTSGEASFGLCPFTEAGFLRVTTSSAYQPEPRSFAEAIAVLQVLKANPRFWFCGINKSWVELTAPFAQRVRGHQQVTDAYLLGLAIEQEAVLVTFDKGVRYLAGAEFARNVLVLE